MKRTYFSALFYLLCCAFALGNHLVATAQDTRWGDQGDGTYVNPVLLSDYSDPDVIRVGKKYYMTCSEFHYMGMPILESDDMVNWRIIGQIYHRFDNEEFDNMTGYGQGTWAPALRYHNGRFWMYVCTPNTGLYMSTATRPQGPWEPLYQVKAIKGWEDPCPFWDDDGQAYLGHSRVGAGPIIIHRMSADGKELLDEGRTVYEGPVAEGTKFLKKDGYYYLSIPEGGVSSGWQTILRSDNIYGPYESRRCLETGSTKVNGPHQGALVDTPDGEWWFFHFQDRSPLGRVLHLQPVKWQADGFPFIGQDLDGNGVGEPVSRWTKPSTGKKRKPSKPQSSDRFRSRTLSPQWAWNHNPLDDYWSLSRRKGWLALEAQKADKLRMARNTLTQKSMGYTGQASVRLDFNQTTIGQRSGLCCIGGTIYAAGVEKCEDGMYLYVERDGTSTLIQQLPADSGKTILLRVTVNDIKNEHQFSYSFDGQHFTDIGDSFSEHNASWKGYKLGLFSYTTQETGGTAYFTDFVYHTDGPSR